jgi:hypothetical protein
MFRKPNRRRQSVVVLEVLVVLFVLAAGCVSLCDAECRMKTLHLTLDGVFVGVLNAGVHYLVLAHRCERLCVLRGVWCVGGRLLWHHVKFGIAGGYAVGVTLAVVECLLR